MSTTIRDLLGCATAAIEQAPSDAALPLAAAAVLGHYARALRDLAYEGPASFGTRRMHAAVADLARACQVAAATWPGAGGHAESLAGAASDAIARVSGPLIPAERWAVAVTMAHVARRCADHARTFPPSRTAPQLTAVHDCAAGVTQFAALYPPSRTERVVLDHSVPSATVPEYLSGMAAAATAAPALAAAVHARIASNTFTVADLLACARAAEMAARYAAIVAHAIEPRDEQSRTWAMAHAAWRAVHGCCAAFDDGSKARPSGTSDALVWAARLETALGDEFNRAASGARDFADIATAMRTIVNQLPTVAREIERTVRHWSRGNHLLARERRLPSYEDRNLDAAHATDGIVFVRGHDLDELAQAAWDAERLTANLAGELDRSSTRVGRQPQPGLAATHAATARSAGNSVLRVHAKRAQARAAATAGSPQWAFTPRPVLARSARTSVGGQEPRRPAAHETRVEMARIDPHAALVDPVGGHESEHQAGSAMLPQAGDLAAAGVADALGVGHEPDVASDPEFEIE